MVHIVEKIHRVFFILFVFFPAALVPASLHAQEEKASPQYVLGWVTVDSIYHGMPMVKPDEENYLPDAEALAELANWHNPTEILVFFGSWCSDSKRELPYFLATLHRARNDSFKPRFLGLDRTKRDSAGVAEHYQITHVPTFVFLRDGLEVGRIVEEPEDTLEKDWVKILHVDPATVQRNRVCLLVSESLWPVILQASTIF